MHIMQIVEVRLLGSAQDALSYAAYMRTSDWLKTWSCLSNFKAVIAEDLEEAFKACRKQLDQLLVPFSLRSVGLRPEYFEFKVADQEVKDGTFWMSPAATRASWFPVKG